MDLGSGGALDVILAAPKVGLQGRAIGVDMTRVCHPSRDKRKEMAFDKIAEYA